MKHAVVLLIPVVWLLGCGAPCEPGFAFPQGPAVKWLTGASTAPFMIEGLGTCAGPDQFPELKARVTGENGELQTPTVWLSREPVDPYADRLRFEGRINDFTPVEGVMKIEVITPNRVHPWLVRYVDPLPFRAERTVPTGCYPPVHLSGDAITCNVVVNTAPFEMAVRELRAEVITTLAAGSRLWSTQLGVMITSSDGIGWLGNDQQLADWIPSAASPGNIRSLAATPRHIFAVIEQELIVLDALDLARVEGKISLQGELGTTPFLVPRGEDLVTLAYAHQVDRSRGDRRDTFALGMNGWELKRTEEDVYFTHAVSNDHFWACAGDRIRLYRVGTNSSEVVAEAPVAGHCDSGEGNGAQRPTVMDLWGLFIQCPYLANGGIELVTIDHPADSSGGCFGEYAYFRERGYPAPSTGLMNIAGQIPR